MKESFMRLLLPLSMIGCYPYGTNIGATRDQAIRRSSVDLSCAPEALDVRFLDQRTAWVRGCGQSAVYLQSCEETNAGTIYQTRSCAWRLDSAVRPIGARAR